jgi:hypothetical protein
VIQWEEVVAVELEAGDLILSSYGPARVRGWRWDRAGLITVDTILRATGTPRVCHYAENGRALRRTKPQQRVLVTDQPR